MNDPFEVPDPTFERFLFLCSLVMIALLCVGFFLLSKPWLSVALGLPMTALMARQAISLRRHRLARSEEVRILRKSIADHAPEMAGNG